MLARSVGGKIGGGKYWRENPEAHREMSIRTGKIGGKKGGKTASSMKVECPYGCGFVSNPGGIGNHKKKCPNRPGGEI